MRILTLPENTNDEIQMLRILLELPELLVHIRKPFHSEKEMATYIMQFTPDERLRLVMHQHHEISIDLGVRHLHFPAAMRDNGISMFTNKRHSGTISTVRWSTSTHSWEEYLALSSSFDAAFISPLYPSFSKPGYGMGRPIIWEDKRSNHTTKLIGLGGINAERLTALKNSTFDDFALCGALWYASDTIKEAQTCYKIIHSY
ncbi:thiamine phosphate synthase [Sphingobacterium psychroaquaticum]|uniref:Thiamine-phosphate pyrophosphorylase n=1 Tax=Sphingobacterium psychroaquaticum TaxID=561061 RepID=A0A1X7JTI6_9SPHI|nr:thiamine phosphate synthase [Sphingobacterium psychroaquaticum]SMG31597.1 thiamine-phosphate pyrophosphorylase [Sphingobacterium psychroaquaticum]